MRQRQPISFAMFDAPRITDCLVAHPRHSDGYVCGPLRALGVRMRVLARTQTYGLAYWYGLAVRAERVFVLTCDAHPGDTDWQSIKC